MWIYDLIDKASIFIYIYIFIISVVYKVFIINCLLHLYMNVNTFVIISQIYQTDKGRYHFSL